MKKLILFTITTLLLLFNCNDYNSGTNVPNEPPIPCEDGVCLLEKQLNFFKEYLEDDTLTKKVLFEMSSMDLSSKDITSLDTGIFDNLTNLTSVDLTDNPICIVDKSNVGLTDRVNLTFDVGGCLTDEQLTFFNEHIMSITTKQELYEATSLDLSSKSITSLDTGIFNNLINVTSVDLTDNTICVDKSNVGLADSVTLTFDGWNCLTDEQLTFFNDHISSITTKKQLYEAPSLDLSSKDITSLDTGIFNNLTNLTSVDLTDNDICIVDTNDVGLADSVTLTFEIGQCLTDEQLTFFSGVTSLNTKQKIYEATSLDLSSKDITSLDTGIFNNLTNLTSVDLTDNDICIVDTNDVGLADSVTLTFEIGQCLTDEQLTFFSGVTSLNTKQKIYEATSLDLSSKGITSLPTGIFDNLTNLTSVDLTDNPICSVDKSNVGLADSVTLTFDGWNCLTDEQLTFFSGVTSLNTKQKIYEATSLDLSSKGITSLPTGIFDNLTNLTSVDLTGNYTCIVDKADVGLADSVNLTLPPLNEDCLTDDQLTFFSGVTSLNTKQKLFEATSLDLSFKSITSLDTGIFNNLTNLTVLRLHFNDLTNIPDGIGNLRALTELTLYNNQLASIPAGIFTKLTNLTRLRLKFSSGETNSFDCNDTNYSTWGLTVPITITDFTCS